ncbi:MAG: M42 family metallopeptidase, partial [Ruminococcus sp.]|nr:M42 family metallopeptidase [Ruminococcus sp.]
MINVPLLKRLCMANGISGDEGAVRELIIEEIKGYADYKIDALGNLLVHKKGKKPAQNRLMLSAHMDEVGMMVTDVTAGGFLKFDEVGGIDRRVLIGKRVLVGEKEIPGVIGLKAYHLTSTEEEKKVPKLKDFYIDIGAKDGEQAREYVSPGDVAVFDADIVEFGHGLIKAKAIDDRIGCAVMVELLKEDLPMDVTFAFTVQEEVGTRGAFGAAFSVTPDIALVLEGTTAADLPDMPDRQKVCGPGKGPVIPFMDGSTVYDRELFEKLRSLAVEHKIPWQTKQYISGGTDAGAIQRTKDGVRVAAISAAVRYLHTPSSVASL